ncbi:hypothetical protein [Ralstonia solanacearum]|uniref:hypothetical protein n=1 Tax=Ralstonia solanacearum TaxID=305 RepID=UPI000AAE591E|nr:hypothetical protein [Ralstonia solanacearum]
MTYRFNHAMQKAWIRIGSPPFQYEWLAAGTIAKKAKHSILLMEVVMRLTNLVGKKSFVFAAVAAALVAGSGSTIAASAEQQIGLTAKNTTGLCVRFFVENSTRDVQPGKTQYWGNAVANKQYMASAFKGACGGKALWNTWYTTDGRAQQKWTVLDVKAIQQ